MKKSAVLILVAIPIMVISFCLPMLARYVIPKAEVTYLKPENYQRSVSASGKIEEVHKSEMQYQLPIVPEEVMVSVGDEVKLGDVIATVDVEKTKDAILSMASLTDYIPSEVVSVIAGMDLDLEVLASQIPNVLTADCSGTISSLNLTSGVISYPTESAATISDLHQLRAKLNIPEEYADEICLDQNVSLKVGALENQKFSGTVQKIFPTANEKLMGTSQETVVGIYVGIDGADEALKSGYSVTGTVMLGDEELVAILPYEAINQDDAGQEYVYIYSKGQAWRRDVETGKELEDGVEILAGVTREESVISDASVIQKDGQYVALTGIS